MARAIRTVQFFCSLKPNHRNRSDRNSRHSTANRTIRNRSGVGPYQRRAGLGGAGAAVVMPIGEGMGGRVQRASRGGRRGGSGGWDFGQSATMNDNPPEGETQAP